MKKQVYSTTNNSVKLYLEYQSLYDTSRSIYKAHINASYLLEALKKICNKLDLSVSIEDIENSNMDPEDIIESLDYNNGNDCDLILLLKNEITGEIYIEYEYYEYFDDEENW